MQLGFHSLSFSLIALGLTGIVILFAGIRITGVADQLADRLGLGEAFVGGLFIGFTTSLSDTVMTVTAAFEGHPALAVDNAIGGVAAQTAFLVIADVAYRKSNLEHAAASLPNIVNGVVLMILLSVPILAFLLPPMSLFGVSPFSVAMVLIYAYGLRLVARTQKSPMWLPKQTEQTRLDRVDPGATGMTQAQLLKRFAGYGLLLGCSGWVLARSAQSIVAHTGLSEGVVGGIIIALISSLPECVVAIQAVRQGAFALAIGDVIGGNAYNMIELPLADLAFQGGSIFHSIGREELYLIALALIMSCVLLLGLLRREQRGFANIGFEGGLILLLYVGGMTGLMFV